MNEINQTDRKAHLHNRQLFISCVVPLYNEAENVAAFFPQLIAMLQSLTNQFEIIAIDDGSIDQTVEKMLALTVLHPIKFISFSRNFGKEIALTAGIEHVKGDVTILIDADFQHPLTLLPAMVTAWANGHDMVYGVRNNRKNESRIKRSFTNLFYWLMLKITKINIPYNAGDFRLLDKKVIAALNKFEERSRFMKGLYAYVGFKTLAIAFDVQDRKAGKSGYRFGKLTELAITGITSFSDVPLRVWGIIGFIISFIALIYAIYIVTITLLFGADRPGFPSLIVAIMFLGGIQLLSVGILGEYIARIFTEVKRRPKYLVALKKGFEDNHI